LSHSPHRPPCAAGKIVSWLKGVGDKVAKGEPIVVVESDKADMDVEAFNDVSCWLMLPCRDRDWRAELCLRGARERKWRARSTPPI
jgi:hypothetical protein